MAFRGKYYPDLTPDKMAVINLVAFNCRKNPALLHSPELDKLKKLVEHYGGWVPPLPKDPSKPENKEQEKPKESEPKTETKNEDDELDLDMSLVIEPDNDPPQKMGNPTLEPTDEEITESQAKRSEAVAAYAAKDYEKAEALYTEAIVLNPQAALLYAKRGQIYLLMNKPNACIRDCNRALELNPDSAAAHKFRGRAKHLLGQFEEAAADLRLACKFDLDDESDKWLREVQPNAMKIEEHKRMKQRKAVEEAEKERAAALKKAREEAKARDDNSRPSQTEAPAADSEPGLGDFYQYLNDPEVIQAFQDPEVAAAFSEISSNPANILKFQNNPKVMALINKAASKFGGAAGGMPAGFPGMMGGIPGAGLFAAGAGAGPKPSAPSPDDDVGLD